MSDVIAATSPAAPEGSNSAGGTSDAKKSGNVSLSRVGQMLGQTPAAPPATEKNAGDTALPAKAEPTTPAAEATNASRATDPGQTEQTAPAQTEPTTAIPENPEDVDYPTDLSQLSNLDPKTKDLVDGLLKQQKDRIQELVNKRIGKEVAKTKTLEEKLAALQHQPQQSVQVPPNGLLPAPAAPQLAPIQPQNFTPEIAAINDVQSLVSKRLEADSFRQKADDALALGPDDSGRYIIDGEALNKEQVIAVRRNATNMLNVQIPQRFNYIQTRQQAIQTAYTEFPWMKDTQSSEYQQALNVLNAQPWLRSQPNAELIVGYHIEGMKALEARKKAAQTPAAPVPTTKPKPPSDQSALGGGSSAPGRASTDTRQRQSLSDEIGKLGNKGGVSARDTAAFLARKFQLSQSR